MENLYFKIGTMPGKFYHVMHKQKHPKVGDRILIRTPDEIYERPSSVIVDEIRNVGGRELYVCYKI